MIFFELKEIKDLIIEAINRISMSFERGGTLFIAGNGGSMSDALHISGELLKSFRIERKGFLKSDLKLQPGVPVWVLGNNPSLYTAVGNDFSICRVEFAQELFAAGKEGDILIGISTSGRAENILKAFEVAKSIGIGTVSLTGDPGEPLSGRAELAIRSPGDDTASIQEWHIKIYHALCSGIESRLFGENGRLNGPYKTRYSRFDFSRIKTYSVYERENRTNIENLIKPENIRPRESENKNIAFLAEETFKAFKSGKPIIFMMGAHLIKNGLSPLIVDLLERGIIRLAAFNGACPIHDTELALCGGTSEKVEESLAEGRFGFAKEAGIVVNSAYFEAYKRKMGAGETLGAVIAGHIGLNQEINFPFKEHSIFYWAYKNNVPATIHAAIGTDIIDQHPNSLFDAKGYASGVDFSIFAENITHLEEGGVIINIGNAVTHPEVFLKSVSMAANIGKPPAFITTAVFDLFDVDLNDIADEEKPGYYRRDIKSMLVRVPNAFKGRGVYIKGNQKKTLVEYYSNLIFLLKD